MTIFLVLLFFTRPCYVVVVVAMPMMRVARHASGLFWRAVANGKL